jgi:hypothetical protein
MGETEHTQLTPGGNNLQRTIADFLQHEPFNPKNIALDRIIEQTIQPTYTQTTQTMEEDNA